jgi:hypothetical protein
MVHGTAMLKQLLELALSTCQCLPSGFLKLLRKGWKKVSEFFQRGVSHMLAPNLTAEHRASLVRLRARVDEEKRKEEEEKLREIEQIERERAKEAAKKEAKKKAANVSTAGATQQAKSAAAKEAEKKAVTVATTSTARETESATAKEPETKPATTVREPPFGPDATIRTAAVFKAVVPVAVRALVKALANTRVKRVEQAEAA